MDRKSLIILVASFLLLMGWYPLMERLGYIKPPAPRTNSVPARVGATNVAGILATNLPAPELRSAGPSPSLTNLASVPAGALQRPERLLVIENDLARYTFTSRGGGLKTVELKKYPETVARRAAKSKAGGAGAAAGDLATINERGSVPVLALLSEPGLMGDFDFQLTQIPNGIRAEKQLTNDLRVVKEITLSTNYLLTAKVRIENSGRNPAAVPAHEWVVGTAAPMTPQDTELLIGSLWYDGSRMERVNDGWFQNRTLGCFPGTPRWEYVGGASNVMWAAVHNQFFATAAVPRTNAHQVVSRKVLLEPVPGATPEEARARTYGFQTSFREAPSILRPGQSVELVMDLFAGPKEYNNLARLAARMGNNLDLVMEFDGFFGWFAKALLLSMNGLNSMGLSYGLSIVAITVIIKMLFWPLTTASTRSMKRMSALQPQMKALQEKYKDDPQKMNQKLMEFMRENKVSPLGGCIPMLLQIPVFFGFYRMLQSAIELRGASFLWAEDLSQADTVVTLSLAGLSFPVNPLPLLMGVTMLWQARLTPPAPGMDPVQQRIMKYMPLMFMVFLYNFSAGLTLYWTVQNLISIAQMKLTKTEDPKSATPAPTPAAPQRKPRK